MTDAALVNEYQRGFPIVPQPFEAIGGALGLTSREVLARYDRLAAGGVVSRIGPVLRPGTIGVSALVALAVPDDAIEQAAAVVNAFPEVSHNYERAHPLNLWFVVSARDAARLHDILDAIARETGARPIALPLLEEYHIDLGFDLDGAADARVVERRAVAPAELSLDERRLLEALQGGLPLVERPFAAVGARIGQRETQVIGTLESLVARGHVRRFGVVVRHFELGYHANAMVVWDVPDRTVAAVGARIAAIGCVRLAYRRGRAREWRYNLYAMIHARNDGELEQHLETVRSAAGDHPTLTLRTVRRFKQRAARFVDGCADG